MLLYIQVYFHMFHDLSVHHSDYILRRAHSPLIPTYHTSTRYTAPMISTLFSMLLNSLLIRRTSHCPLWAGALTTCSYMIRQMHQVYSMRLETTCVSRSVSAHN